MAPKNAEACQASTVWLSEPLRSVSGALEASQVTPPLGPPGGWQPDLGRLFALGILVPIGTNLTAAYKCYVAIQRDTTA